MNSVELAKRIIDCLSDGYDDEENRTETENVLYNDLSQISNDSFIKAAFMRLCERIEELEEEACKGIVKEINPSIKVCLQNGNKTTAVKLYYYRHPGITVKDALNVINEMEEKMGLGILK